MKKAISLMLVLVLCMALCACSKSSESSDSKTSTPPAHQLAGQWSASDNSGFTLLSSGNVVNISSLETAATKSSSGITAGSWEVEGDYLIIITENYNAYKSAWVYKIVNSQTVTRNGVTYTKSN